MKKIFFAAIAFSFILQSCETTQHENATSKNDSTAIEKDTLNTLEKNGIKLSPVTNLPEFLDAQLTQNQPTENSTLKPGTNSFTFEVKNYQLGAQTDSKSCNHCSNSDQGQHIHFILNNAPYVALYEPKQTQDLTEGTYIELAFLSRSYHISIKQPQAYILKKFNVGKKNDLDKVDLNTPHMFYSRPKGDYSGTAASKIVLDFYLVNTDLSKDGNKVKATVDENEFLIEKWDAYLIEGLKDGEHSIKLELIDKEGKTIESPFNPVTRTITVSSATKKS